MIIDYAIISRQPGPNDPFAYWPRCLLILINEFANEVGNQVKYATGE